MRQSVQRRIFSLEDERLLLSDEEFERQQEDLIPKLVRLISDANKAVALRTLLVVLTELARVYDLAEDVAALLDETMESIRRERTSPH